MNTSQSAKQPNLLVIVVDDMGWSDLSAFGGEADTPHLDALTARGVRLTNFHTSPVCSTTRAMLMTGCDHHEVGMGCMVETMTPEMRGKPGYEGYLTDRASTIAERLRDAIGTPFNLQGYELYASASIGIVKGNTSYRSVDDLLRDADTGEWFAGCAIAGPDGFKKTEEHDTAPPPAIQALLDAYEGALVWWRWHDDEEDYIGACEAAGVLWDLRGLCRLLRSGRRGPSLCKFRVRETLPWLPPVVLASLRRTLCLRRSLRKGPARLVVALVHGRAIERLLVREIGRAHV